MINFNLTSITKSYEYYYFDSNQNIQSKYLNIFQRILRNAFGCYRSTHLSRVVNKGYRSIFNDTFPINVANNQKLLKIIKKEQKKHGSAKFYKISQKNTSDNNKLETSVRYNICRLSNKNHTLEIDSIEFELSLGSIRNVVHIEKNKELDISGNPDRVIVSLSHQFFKGKHPFDVENMTHSSKNEIVQTTNEFLKIIDDSMEELRFPFESSQFVENETSPRKIYVDLTSQPLSDIYNNKVLSKSFSNSSYVFTSLAFGVSNLKVY